MENHAYSTENTEALKREIEELKNVSELHSQSLWYVIMYILYIYSTCALGKCACMTQSIYMLFVKVC